MATCPPLRYDPAAAALYALTHDDKKTWATHLRKFPVGGTPFAAEWSVPVTLPKRSSYPQLGWDGSHLYRDLAAFAAADGKSPAEPLAEPYSAVLRDVAVGYSGKLYHPTTGAVLGELPHAAESAAIAADGRSVWVHHRKERKLTRYKLEAGAVAPPPKVAPPKAGGRPVLPYPAGTQTVPTESLRIAGADPRATTLIAAEPLGLLAAKHADPLTGGLRLYDTATKTLVGLRPPTREAVADLFAPPDRTALFVHDRKKVYRLSANRKGWESGDLPADTRHVVARDKDRLIALASVAVSATVLHELTWADGKLTVVRETKVPLGLGAPRVTPAGDRLLALGRALYGETGLKLHEFDLTEKGPTAARALRLRAQREPTLGTFRLSWDGTHAHRFTSAFVLSGKLATEIDPPAKGVRVASRDLLITDSGEYFTPAGKSLGKLGHAVRAADVTPDGKAVWTLDPTGKEFVKYALTDGK